MSNMFENNTEVIIEGWKKPAWVIERKPNKVSVKVLKDEEADEYLKENFNYIYAPIGKGEKFDGIIKPKVSIRQSLMSYSLIPLDNYSENDL